MTDRTLNQSPAKSTVTLESIKTSLKAVKQGKQERNKAYKKAELHLQMFKPNDVEASGKVRLFAVLANNGNVSFHRLSLFFVSNSYTNNDSMKSRPVFVSTACDPNTYTTKSNNIIHSDSNDHLVKMVYKPDNNMNSIIVKGALGSELIPFDNNWDNKEHNKHTIKLYKVLSRLKDVQATQSELDNAYRTAWKEYVDAENALVEQGLLVKNSIIIAELNSVVPGLTLSQYASSSNKYFDSSKVFNNADNPDSTATYCPLINSINATVDFTDNTSDAHTSFVYRSLIKGGNKDAENADNSGIGRYAVEAYAYDLVNNRMSTPVRVIVSDTLYKTKTSRSENFQNFVDNNPTGSIYNGQLVLAPRLGGYTSTFSIEGENLSYTTFKNKEVQGITFNETVEGDIEVDDLESDVMDSDDDFDIESYMSGSSEVAETKTVESEF